LKKDQDDNVIFFLEVTDFPKGVTTENFSTNDVFDKWLRREYSLRTGDGCNKEGEEDNEEDEEDNGVLFSMNEEMGLYDAEYHVIGETYCDLCKN